MGDAIPNWIERLLGIKTEAGEGTVWGIEYAWGWPPWVTLLFAACAAIFVVAIYLREDRTTPRPYRMMLAAHAADADRHPAVDDRPDDAVAETDRAALCGRADRRFVEHDHGRSL